MNKNKYHDYTYLELVRDVLENGVEKEDRTGTGTLSVFGREMRFDLSNNSIPLLTIKKMHTKSIITEILWYLTGDTNVKFLQDNGVRIWNEWADDEGNLGPVYGEQWRKWATPNGTKINWQTDPPTPEIEWKYIDQIADVIHKLKNTPDDRRIIVNAWNVGELDEMALPPCHYTFQFWVNGNELSCKLTQRSADVGLGVPFNIAQYSILTHMIAQVAGLEAKEFIWSGGDVHVYKNHIRALEEQLDIMAHPSPTIMINKDVKNIDDFKIEDFEIMDYKSHPTIKMEVSV